ncbi:hypothetical protein A4G20_00625 [Pasteurellaceae bacterium RH1A]|nr:hypothetical protein A4G20_00625 [Pasteurellaceae bacterium RH1A]
MAQIKIPAADQAKIQLAQAQGFNFVMGQVCFELTLAKKPPLSTACKAEEADLPALLEGFSTAFAGSRFCPPYFSGAENQRFYAKWLENAVKGQFDDECWLIKQGRQIQGLISWKREEDHCRIGLLAVAPAFQGQGLGQALLELAAQQTGLPLHITTQQHNLPAIRLYEKLGGRLISSHYWFYKVEKYDPL